MGCRPRLDELKLFGLAPAFELAELIGFFPHGDAKNPKVVMAAPEPYLLPRTADPDLIITSKIAGSPWMGRGAMMTSLLTTILRPSAWGCFLC